MSSNPTGGDFFFTFIKFTYKSDSVTHCYYLILSKINCKREGEILCEEGGYEETDKRDPSFVLT